MHVIPPDRRSRGVGVEDLRQKKKEKRKKKRKYLQGKSEGGREEDKGKAKNLERKLNGRR